MVFKETKIKNIKITDAKLCGECSTIQTSNFIHLTSAIYSPYDRGYDGMAEAFGLQRYKILTLHQPSYFNHQTSISHHRNLIGSPSAFIKADNDRLL